jgi:polyisoprenoid-binding protein YceI
MTTPTQPTDAGPQAQLANGSLAGAWTLDPAQSAVAFASRSIWGLVPVRGVFTEVTGHGTITPDGEVTGQIEVSTGSLDTKNAKRDEHLRSADFFLSEEFPVLTFELDNVAVTGADAAISGTLTVRDQTRPVSWTARATVATDNEIALDATVAVDRSEFGLTWSPLHLSSMQNKVTIHAVFSRA